MYIINVHRESKDPLRFVKAVIFDDEDHIALKQILELSERHALTKIPHCIVYIPSNDMEDLPDETTCCTRSAIRSGDTGGETIRERDSEVE